MFYKIGEDKVFLTNERDKFLCQMAEKDDIKGDEYGFLSDEDAKKREKRIHDYLKNLKENNPTDFRNNWIMFDIKGDAVISYVKDVLSDFCITHSDHKLRRYPSMKNGDHYVGDTFALELEHEPKYSFLRDFLNNRKKTVSFSIFINTDDIYRIKGTLNSFLVYSKNYIILCYEYGVSIYPPYIKIEIEKFSQIK